MKVITGKVHNNSAALAVTSCEEANTDQTGGRMGAWQKISLEVEQAQCSANGHLLSKAHLPLTQCS